MQTPLKTTISAKHHNINAKSIEESIPSKTILKSKSQINQIHLSQSNSNEIQEYNDIINNEPKNFEHSQYSQILMEKNLEIQDLKSKVHVLEITKNQLKKLLEKTNYEDNEKINKLFQEKEFFELDLNKKNKEIEYLNNENTNMKQTIINLSKLEKMNSDLEKNIILNKKEIEKSNNFINSFQIQFNSLKIENDNLKKYSLINENEIKKLNEKNENLFQEKADLEKKLKKIEYKLMELEKLPKLIEKIKNLNSENEKLSNNLLKKTDEMQVLGKVCKILVSEKKEIEEKLDICENKYINIEKEFSKIARRNISNLASQKNDFDNQDNFYKEIEKLNIIVKTQKEEIENIKNNYLHKENL